MKCPSCNHQWKPERKKKESDPRIKEFLTRFENLWPFDGKPIFSFGRDGKVVKTLLSQFDLEYLVFSLPEYFHSEDMFFKKCSFDIPRFSQYIQSQNVMKPSVKLEKNRAEEELKKHLQNRKNTTLISGNLSSEAKKLFYTLGRHYNEVQRDEMEGKDIFEVKEQVVDYKSLAGNDE